jgi:hypothetical protein
VQPDSEIDRTIVLLNAMLEEEVDGKKLGMDARLKITDRLLKAYALKAKINPDPSGSKFGNRGQTNE